jgi:flagellar assembly protein FliH
VERARDAAYQEGLREGQRQGAERAVAEVEPVLSRLLRTIEDLSATRDEFRREAEEDIVRLSLGIARRVLHREVSIDPGALSGVVRVALDKIGARELHRVLVAEQDQPAIAAGIAAARLNRRIEVVADPNLERGAVLFETTKGTLDASLETQLDEIERGLVDALKER